MARPKLKQRADGRYRCIYKGKAFYGDTQAEAYRKRDEYRRQLEAGLNADATKITVREYAAKWLSIHKSDVGDKTYNDYARLLNVLVNAYGDYACSAITPDDARAVFAKHFKPKKHVGEKGYSGSTIKRAHMLYVGMFDAAVENRICASNPFRSKVAKPVYGADGTHREITDAERQLILTTEHWFQPCVMLMLYAGLRRGEALAVNVATDVDADCKWLTVRQAIRYDSNRPILTAPKTDAGTRTVPIFPPLKPYIVGKEGLLVKSRNNKTYLSESAFTSAWRSYVAAIEARLNGVEQKRWYGLTVDAKTSNPARYSEYLALRQAGKKEEAEQVRLQDYKCFTVRPHDLRHSFCTMLRDAGVDIKQTIEWMGHADEKMVLRIYDHLGTRRAVDSVKKVENLLCEGQNEGQS